MTFWIVRPLADEQAEQVLDKMIAAAKHRVVIADLVRSGRIKIPISPRYDVHDRQQRETPNDQGHHG
ncbi:MAG: hypothetical protein QGF59_02405, partial [Pirellulaceae bacterium]|nr:hypothetical protein [Pirellulaceae bacterium]